MKVVSVGAGNVANHLVTELYNHSFDIIQVYSRTIESAQLLAKKVNAVPVNDVSAIINDADIYIFSLKDSVIKDIANQIPENSGIWIHTAGSIDINIFRKYTKHYGVLYPFQTFTKGRNIEWKKIPLFTEASDNKTLSVINAIARQLSDRIVELSSDKRRYLHLTGVFACNFTNHMYALSEFFLKEAGLSFDVALPLIDETSSKVHSLSPKDAQTGPAVRFDQKVMNDHLSIIEDETTKSIYKLISESIHKSNNI
ncbi:MAG: DUF2520 domain-containing protein [Prevotella sp.]|jgi:predicted short-subunit dehydrogenase-like oxidoreductase (DUF2520 family)|nr:DUF2520 domain-containing protein [Prevotella sp.]